MTLRLATLLYRIVTGVSVTALQAGLAAAEEEARYWRERAERAEKELSAWRWAERRAQS